MCLYVYIYIYICISVCSHWFTRNYLLILSGCEIMSSFKTNAHWVPQLNKWLVEIRPFWWCLVLHALYDQDRGKVAGWFEPDPPHRRHNNHHIACHAADLKPVKKEIQIGLLTNEAPFKGCGFWGQLKEYADELFEVSYPKLSHHMHKGRVPIYEYGIFEFFVFGFYFFVFF